MRKLRESDFIQQRNAACRALSSARSRRKYDPFKKSKPRPRMLSRVIITAPEKISFFDDSYKPFWSFIEDIKTVAETNTIYLDLKPAKYVKVSAMLVLYSVIEQMQKVHGSIRIIKSSACFNVSIASKFQVLGFWDLMREGRTRNIRFHDEGIPICTASYANKLSGDEQDQLRMALNYVQGILDEGEDDEQSGLAFAAITESVSNVWQHAYSSAFYMSDVDPALKNWWIIAERIADQLYIAVYDMGVGIPKTLGAKPNFADMLIDAGKGIVALAAKMVGRESTFSPGEKDAASIKAAVDYGRSRFNVSGRGKGLSEARDFVSNNPRGSLFIYSGSGAYSYYTKDKLEEVEALPSEFVGTLIQWNIKLTYSGA